MPVLLHHIFKIMTLKHDGKGIQSGFATGFLLFSLALLANTLSNFSLFPEYTVDLSSLLVKFGLFIVAFYLLGSKFCNPLHLIMIGTYTISAIVGLFFTQGVGAMAFLYTLYAAFHYFTRNYVKKE